MIVKRKAVELAEIACLADTQNYTFQKTVEAAQDLDGRRFGAVPRTYCLNDRCEKRVLANTLTTAEHERVVYFFGRVLHTMCEPVDDMLSIVTKKFFGMCKPRFRVVTTLNSRTWRTV